MTSEKLTSVFKYYSWYIQREKNVGIKQHEEPSHWIDKYEHLRWMCQTAVTEFIPAGRIDKAMRWLGFIQGSLFEMRVFTLNQLKDHSRPETDLEAFYVEDPQQRVGV